MGHVQSGEVIGSGQGLEAMRRHALGGVLMVWRGHKGLSVENAAKFMGIGHMTLRRLEAGTPVRNGTYAHLEDVFNLQRGHLQRALGDDDAMVDLARDLGVDTTAVAEGYDPRRWLLSLARKTQPEDPFDVRAQGGTATLGATATITAGGAPVPPMVVTVSDLVSRLVARRRTPAEEDALQALLRLLPELAQAS